MRVPPARPHSNSRAVELGKSGRWDSNPRPSPWQGDVLPLNHARRSIAFGAESAESQNRTDDTAIFSRVLYQLSYLGRMHVFRACRILLDEYRIVKQGAQVAESGAPLDYRQLRNYNPAPQ